jgi:homoserine dehydrogenase
MKHRVVLIGFGVVGKSVADILVRKREAFKTRHGFECTVVAICDGRCGTVYEGDGLDLTARLGEVRSGARSPATVAGTRSKRSPRRTRRPCSR